MQYNVLLHPCEVLLPLITASCNMGLTVIKRWIFIPEMTAVDMQQGEQQPDGKRGQTPAIAAQAEDCFRLAKGSKRQRDGQHWTLLQRPSSQGTSSEQDPIGRSLPAIPRNNNVAETVSRSAKAQNLLENQRLDISRVASVSGSLYEDMSSGGGLDRCLMA